jgi:hypothetical protein
MKNKEYTKAVNSGKLWQEIIAVFSDLIDVHTFREGNVEKVYIEFENDKDGAEEATLDSLVISHTPIDLEDLKKSKNALIDERTKQLIYEGYVHDNNTFSLSMHAQRNWIAIASSFEANLSVVRKGTPSLTFEQAYDAVEASLYPLAVSTHDDLEYVFDSYDEYITFYNAAYAHANNHYMTGRELKDQVNNAVDEATLNAIVDTR